VVLPGHQLTGPSEEEEEEEESNTIPFPSLSYKVKVDIMAMGNILVSWLPLIKCCSR
jgi:hypothetical protein